MSQEQSQKQPLIWPRPRQPKPVRIRTADPDLICHLVLKSFRVSTLTMTLFDERKTKILQELASNEPDLSPKGSPDDGVLALLELLNAHHDYITTSSCSGRAVVFVDADRDGQGGDARGRWLMNR